MVDPLVIDTLTSPFARFFSFLWGLLWGSFCNVLIHRIPRGQSPVFPRSRCGQCEAPIAWYDNIPVVSYLLLRGQCRKCGSKFSLRYLTVELLAGTLSAVLYMVVVVFPLMQGGDVSALIRWVIWLFFALALLVVTYIDIDFWIIPDSIVLPLGVIGIALAWVESSWIGIDGSQATIAAISGYVVVWTIRAIYLRFRGIEGMGLGDGKLLFMVGAFCGYSGLFWTLGAGAIQGLLIGVPLLLLGRSVATRDIRDVHGDDPLLGDSTNTEDNKLMTKYVPFGPFLALAAIEYVLFHGQLTEMFGGFI